MKEYFLKVCLEKYDFEQENISPKGMVRLIASGKVFYLNEDDFENAQVFLKRLKLGDELKICAELLNDGSFWVQWIYHPTKGRLEPERTFTLTKKQIKWLFISFVSLIASILIGYYAFVESESALLLVILGVISVLLFMLGAVYLFEKIYLFCKLTRPKHKKIIKALDSVIAHKDTASLNSLLLDIPGIKQSKLPNLKLIKNKECKFKNSLVKRIRGKVSLYHANKINIVRYRSSYSLYQASFSINQHPFVLLSQDRPFYSDHNIFIADGDDIEVFYLQSGNEDLGPIILGAYNYTDNGAYLISGQFYIGHQRAKKSIYWILGGVTAFIFSILFFFSASDIYDNGNYWDKWDWLSIADTFLFFGVIYFCIISGIAFIISLLSNLYLSSSDRGYGCNHTYELLKENRFNNQKSSYITELNV